MTPSDLLAAVRSAAGIPSNYRLARVLEVSEKTVQRWQVGANAPDAAMCERLATMAGLDPDVIVAAMQAHREREPAERARWERIARRLQAVAAVVVAGILSGFVGGGPDAAAYAAPPARVAAMPPGLCITSNRRRMLAQVLAWLWSPYSALRMLPAAA